MPSAKAGRALSSARTLRTLAIAAIVVFLVPALATTPASGAPSPSPSEPAEEPTPAPSEPLPSEPGPNATTDLAAILTPPWSFTSPGAQSMSRLTIVNHASDVATNLRAVVTATDGAEIVAVDSSDGTCEIVEGNVICDFARLEGATYRPGEPPYLDVDSSRDVSVGDVRLFDEFTRAGLPVRQPLSRVLAIDDDFGLPLVPMAGFFGAQPSDASGIPAIFLDFDEDYVASVGDVMLSPAPGEPREATWVTTAHPSLGQALDPNAFSSICVFDANANGWGDPSEPCIWSRGFSAARVKPCRPVLSA